MDEVFIDIRKVNEDIKKHFPNKDYVTIENLLSVIEDLSWEIEHYKEEIKDLKRDINENYELKKFDPYEEYGISEYMFH